MASAASRAAAASSMRPPEPGAVGTPARAATSRATALSPMARIVSGLGPTNASPALSTIAAKSAFSDRKP